MSKTHVSASPRSCRSPTRALALAAALGLGALGCDASEPTRPADDAEAKPLSGQLAAQRTVARGKSGKHVIKTRRSVPKFKERGPKLSGSAATDALKDRLKAAIASGDTRAWKQRMRASDGREIEVGAEDMLTLLEKYDPRNARDVGRTAPGLFRPAAFQSDTGVISISGWSQAPAYGNGFDFYTTSIASTSSVPHKWLLGVRHNTTNRVMLPNGALVFERTASDQASLNSGTAWGIHTSVWGGVGVDGACGYDSAISSGHYVDGQKWVVVGLLVQPVEVTTSSAGSDYIRRPCNPPPTSLCDDASTCDLDGDGDGDRPPSAVGGEVEWEIDVPSQPGGKLVCMVTDWYDQHGHYLDTQIDYCWIE